MCLPADVSRTRYGGSTSPSSASRTAATTCATKPSPERPITLNMYGPGNSCVSASSSAEGRLSTIGLSFVNRQLTRYYTCRPPCRVSAKKRPMRRSEPDPRTVWRHNMPASWTVLASGSGGNASLLETNEAGLLVDIGLGPRQLAERLRQVGFAWERIRAVILTHTHGDHWSARSLAKLSALRVPF